ncbi:hypothetical protein E4U17_006377 [Claviceps sp. LM77 group G4]|nr:hypothetical protein E4U17_006377 [Claviceps sp. LM77 group G4]KAG6069566.1 hypothetical protein E4U33_004739 [Claviceps sp. LM78 group G4]KAG6085264.1 hypothetical protein E4U16_006855 [Claviceps sp. LM84 group G4]
MSLYGADKAKDVRQSLLGLRNVVVDTRREGFRGLCDGLSEGCLDGDAEKFGILKGQAKRVLLVEQRLSLDSRMSGVVFESRGAKHFLLDVCVWFESAKGPQRCEVNKARA